jgi:hypothetical protein
MDQISCLLDFVWLDISNHKGLESNHKGLESAKPDLQSLFKKPVARSHLGPHG